jgi:hypothetical protein
MLWMLLAQLAAPNTTHAIGRRLEGSESPACARFVIVHEAHEGSHAIEQAMTREFGTLPFNEMFDGREIGTGWELTQARGAFARGDKDALLQIMRAKGFNGYKTSAMLPDIAKYDCARGGVMSAIVRPTQLATWMNPHVAVFILVRTDAMRFALSLAKEVTSGCPYPQFGKCDGVARGKRELSLKELRGTVETTILRVWRAKARTALSVVRGEHVGEGVALDCSRAKFVFYEAFVDAPDQVTADMWAHLERVSQGAAKWQTGALKVDLAVKKQHSDKISSFVANAHDVYDMFTFAHLPTFADVLEESGFLKLCPLSPGNGGKAGAGTTTRSPRVAAEPAERLTGAAAARVAGTAIGTLRRPRAGQALKRKLYHPWLGAHIS